MSDMIGNRALAVSQWVTARETSKTSVLLFTPSDEQEGYRTPSAEIHLTYDDIRKLAAWITPPMSNPIESREE